MIHSIRFKITALTIGAILVAIGCVFLASSTTVQNEIDRHSVETMTLIGEDTRKSLEKYTESIDSAADIAGSIASDMLDSTVLVEAGIVGTSAQGGTRTPEQIALLDAYLASYCQAFQKEFATVATHTKGVITYYYCICPEVSETEHGFFYSKVGKTGFDRREPLDARTFDPNDLEHYTWYYTPIERGRPSWIGPYTAHFLNEMRICSYLVPIYKAGALIGVLGMDISIDTLVEQVRSIRVYDSGFACLLDESGRVIYHPDLPYGTIPDLSVTPEMLRDETSGTSLLSYSADGRDRQMSFTTLSNGMKLVIVAPTDEVEAAFVQLIHTIAATTIGVVTVFSVVFLFGTSLITQPLLRLTAAAQRLADADYNVSLDYHSRDEVGALTSAFQRMRDQIEADIADLNQRVHTDDLTGLPNQRYFFRLAEEERRRLLAEGKSPVILFFNLNGMKHFNRQFGFQQGDTLICEVADILADEFGSKNTSRFGQDHFAAITDEERMDDSIQRVFQACRSANGGVSLPVSVGVFPNSLSEVEVSVACDRAKSACDQRRGSYFSGVRTFDEGMLKQIELVRHIIDNLDRALEERWIKVYYQPIIRAVNGCVCDEEALSRWIDPVMGPLSPADFIGTLEQSGFIYKLDLYVLDEVLAKMQLQREAGLTVVPHSINLSRSDFDSCDIVEEICRRVDAAGVERRFISIEITESIIGSDFDFMSDEIRRFRELGFPVWMDDFGSGYSSLDVLQSIEFDLLKFDMSFLRRFDESDNTKVILTDLIKMVTALGIDTLCEGVETEEQYRFLHEIGCAKLQGYHFSRPIPLETLLASHASGEAIPYENLDEAEYYASLGKVNLYDPGVTTSTGEDGEQQYLGTIPMAVLELRNDSLAIVRANKPYREFVVRMLHMPEPSYRLDDTRFVNDRNRVLIETMAAYSEDGEWTRVKNDPHDGIGAHAYVRKLATNPVNDAQAYAVVVFSMMD